LGGSAALPACHGIIFFLSRSYCLLKEDHSI
jgi:hypothetical protein